MKKTLVALLVAFAVPTVALGAGSAIYKTRCAPCHGADGSGQTPAGKSLKIVDLRSAEVQKMSDAEMRKVLADGKGKMPKSNLSDDDAKAVIAFIRSFKK